MLTSARANPFEIAIARTNPFEIVMILAGLLAGIAGLVGWKGLTFYGYQSPWAQLFSAGLALGTGTVALSLFLRPPMTLLIERVGMIWLASLSLPYGVSCVINLLIKLNLPRPLWVLIVAYGVACAARALQITHDLQRYRREVQQTIGDLRRRISDPH